MKEDSIEKKLDEILTILRNIERNNIPQRYYIPENGNYRVCRTWKDCTNPQMDCINCPLRYNGGDSSFNTTYATSTDVDIKENGILKTKGTRTSTIC